MRLPLLLTKRLNLALMVGSTTIRSGSRRWYRIGAHIWADRFDGALDDIFELQDHVASSGPFPLPQCGRGGTAARQRRGG